jgi:outer membrane immunogenic protein
VEGIVCFVERASTWRIGYAWDRLLGYVKAGAAWERIDYTMAAVSPASGLYAATDRETGGWVIGIGAEYSFTDWLSAFVEYQYLDFGTCTNTFTSNSSLVANFNIRDTKNLVKAGLNLRFSSWFE